MAEPRKESGGAAGRAQASAARADRKVASRRRSDEEDPTFARLLQARSQAAIVPEAAQRLETGRRRYASLAETSTAAELAMLREERRRLQQESGGDGRRLTRITRLVESVEISAAAAGALQVEIERAEPLLPGGWTVVGRVLARDGRVPTKAEVVFADAEGQEVKALGRLALAKDGTVRKAYPRELAEKLQESGVQVGIVVRLNRRVVGAEDRRVRVHPGRVHQFDLRVDAGDEPGGGSDFTPAGGRRS
jgi:hypothetical protein